MRKLGFRSRDNLLTDAQKETVKDLMEPFNSENGLARLNVAPYIGGNDKGSPFMLEITTTFHGSYLYTIYPDGNWR